MRRSEVRLSGAATLWSHPVSGPPVRHSPTCIRSSTGFSRLPYIEDVAAARETARPLLDPVQVDHLGRTLTCRRARRPQSVTLQRASRRSLHARNLAGETVPRFSAAATSTPPSSGVAKRSRVTLSSARSRSNAEAPPIRSWWANSTVCAAPPEPISPARRRRQRQHGWVAIGEVSRAFNVFLAAGGHPGGGILLGGFITSVGSRSRSFRHAHTRSRLMRVRETRSPSVPRGFADVRGPSVRHPSGSVCDIRRSRCRSRTVGVPGHPRSRALERAIQMPRRSRRRGSRAVRR